MIDWLIILFSLKKAENNYTWYWQIIILYKINELKRIENYW